MPQIPIDSLFYNNRFSHSPWHVMVLLLYSPVGTILAAIRMFMVLQAYIAASLLRSHVSIRRFVLRIVGCALGIIVEEKNECARDESCRLLLSNHSTIFDFIPIHLLTNCETLIHTESPQWLINGIGLKNLPNNNDDDKLSMLHSELTKEGDPVLIFPETEMTNGKLGLLKFSSWWASEVDSVQPIALTARRPSAIDVKASVIGSVWYTDYFWSFFVPYTTYSIKYLPVIKKNKNESNESFSERIQKSIAEEMEIEPTTFTIADKLEYVKRYLKDCSKPTKVIKKSPRKFENHSELQKMVNQVAEVFPNISRDLILRNLEVNKDVDVTITNILEGKIPANDQQSTAGPSSSRLANSNKVADNFAQQQLSFHERKAKLLEDARRKYKEKHNIA